MAFLICFFYYYFFWGFLVGGLVLVINGEYEKRKTVINNLHAELDRLAPEIREKARKGDDMAERMKDLKV